jgi:hypothetical protein
VSERCTVHNHHSHLGRHLGCSFFFFFFFFFFFNSLSVIVDAVSNLFPLTKTHILKTFETTKFLLPKVRFVPKAA